MRLQLVEGQIIRTCTSRHKISKQRSILQYFCHVLHVAVLHRGVCIEIYSTVLILNNDNVYMTFNVQLKLWTY